MARMPVSMQNSRRFTRISAPLDPTGTADPAEPAADPVLGPVRAAADGADELQLAVTVVRGPRD